MKILVNGKLTEVKTNATVFDALRAAKINPETVLVKRKATLIPHDELVKANDRLDLISVISGG